MYFPHSIMKHSAFVAALLTIGLAACNTSGTISDTDSSASSSSASSVEAVTSSAPASSSQAAASVAATTESETRVIAVTSTDWEFNPLTINAKKGEKVIVRLTNNQGIHSFGAMELGLNVRINPGETKDIVIPTDKAGSFEFRCMVPCGPGHRDMKGTIVIS